MPRGKNQKKEKAVPSLRLQNSELGGDFDIFLPRGWRITKPSASQKPRAKKMSRQKRRKR